MGIRPCGAKGIRTPDLLIANETRYQLRHSPMLEERGRSYHRDCGVRNRRRRGPPAYSPTARRCSSDAASAGAPTGRSAVTGTPEPTGTGADRSMVRTVRGVSGRLT